MTFYNQPLDPAPSVPVMGRYNPNGMQGALNRAYNAADLEAPVLIDPAVDQAIVAVRADLDAAIDELLADGQDDAVDSVLDAAGGLAKLDALDRLADRRRQTAPARAHQAFLDARAKAYSVDLLDAAEETVQTIIDSVDMLAGVDPFDLEAIVRHGLPATAWTDLTEALVRMADLGAIDGQWLRWVDVPTPEAPLFYDNWGGLLPDVNQDPVNRAVYRLMRQRENRDGRAMDVDHLIVSIARGDFAPLELSFTGDEAELNRRRQAWNDALRGTKLNRDEYLAKTGRKPKAPVVSPASWAFTHA